MTKTHLLTLGGLLAASSLAHSAVLYSNDFNLSGFDNTTAIDPATNGEITLGAITSVESIAITIAHTWASDLTFQVTASNGSTFTLFSGQGGGGNLGTPGQGAGPTYTLADAQTYTFVATGGDPVFNVNANGTDIVAGTYDANTWVTDPVGGYAAGTWRINLVDGAGGDQGFVSNITINGVAAVPEPSSTALLGLGSVALLARRKRS